MISINVYALWKDEQQIIPKFVTKCGAREKHIDHLLLSSETDDICHLHFDQKYERLDL
jgi:hypothetical protein